MKSPSVLGINSPAKYITTPPALSRMHSVNSIDQWNSHHKLLDFNDHIRETPRTTKVYSP